MLDAFGKGASEDIQLAKSELYSQMTWDKDTKSSLGAELQITTPLPSPPPSPKPRKVSAEDISKLLCFHSRHLLFAGIAYSTIPFLQISVQQSLLWKIVSCKFGVITRAVKQLPCSPEWHLDYTTPLFKCGLPDVRMANMVHPVCRCDISSGQPTLCQVSVIAGPDPSVCFFTCCNCSTEDSHSRYSFACFRIGPYHA